MNLCIYRKDVKSTSSDLMQIYISNVIMIEPAFKQSMEEYSLEGLTVGGHRPTALRERNGREA